MIAASTQRQVDFWSSTEYSSFLPGLTSALVTQGWKGQSRYEISEADYRGARGRRARFALRWRAYVRYPWNLGRALRAHARTDVAVVCTNTFYVPRLCTGCLIFFLTF
jgi:hypothetical protein